MTAGALLAGLLALRSRLLHAIERFPLLRKVGNQITSSYHHFIDTYRIIITRGKTVFAFTMTLTTIQWVCRYSIISALLAGFGIPPRPMLFMALQVIVFAAMTFIPTPGGAGGAEAVFFIIYRSFLPADTIGVVTAVWRFFTFYFLLIVAALLFLLFRVRTSAERPVKADTALP
jgi:uncharacterized protein (TIRG00374 family)